MDVIEEEGEEALWRWCERDYEGGANVVNAEDGYGMCQAFCVNGLFFLRRHSGRWESGNPAFGFPLFHGPQFFFVFVRYSKKNNRLFSRSSSERARRARARRGSLLVGDVFKVSA